MSPCSRSAIAVIGRMVAAAVLVYGLSACFVRRSVAVEPSASGGDVIVSFGPPRDVRLAYRGRDTLLIREVRRLEGRLVRISADTAWVRPVTRVVTATGTTSDPSAGESVATRVVLDTTTTASASRPTFAGVRTGLLFSALIAFVVIVSKGLGAELGLE